MPFTHLSSLTSMAFWAHDSLWDSRYLPDILLMVSFLGALTYILTI